MAWTFCTPDQGRSDALGAPTQQRFVADDHLLRLQCGRDVRDRNGTAGSAAQQHRNRDAAGLAHESHFAHGVTVAADAPQHPPRLLPPSLMPLPRQQPLEHLVALTRILVQERQLKSRQINSMFYHFPPLTDLFAAITRLLWLGFVLLTFGIAAGFLTGQPLPYMKIAWSLGVWIFYAAILWLLFAAPFAWRRRRRIKRGLCPACAYDLRGRGSDSKTCPECGKAVKQ